MAHLDEDAQDWQTLILILSGVGGFGLFSIWVFLKPLYEWLIEVNVLVRDSILVPIGPEAGLDLVRMVVCCGVLVLLGLGGYFLARSRFDRAHTPKRRGRQ